MSDFGEALLGLDPRLMSDVALNLDQSTGSPNQNIGVELAEYPAFPSLLAGLRERWVASESKLEPGIIEQRVAGAMACLEVFTHYVDAERSQGMSNFGEALSGLKPDLMSRVARHLGKVAGLPPKNIRAELAEYGSFRYLLAGLRERWISKGADLEARKEPQAGAWACLEVFVHYVDAERSQRMVDGGQGDGQG